MAVLRTTSESLLFKSLIKFCLDKNDDNEIISNNNDESHHLCCSSNLYGYLFVSWMSILYCFEWKKIDSYLSNPSEAEISASDALVKLEINSENNNNNNNNNNIHCIKLSTSERYLAIKSANEVFILSIQDILLTKQLKILHRIRLESDNEVYSCEWNRFDNIYRMSATDASALDQLAVIINKKIVFFEPYKQTSREVTRSMTHTAEYSQFLAACWHPTEPTLLAVADGNQLFLFKNGKIVSSSQSPLVRSTSHTGTSLLL